MEETKTCEVCGRTLPISQFYKNSATADGVDYRCKECSIHKRKKTTVRNRKAFDVKDLTDDALCGELRRRGFTGELQYRKIISI